MDIETQFSHVSEIDEEDLDEINENTWPPLVYIAGYAAYAAIKKTKCGYCNVYLSENENSFSNYNSAITSMNRGGLCYPSKDVVLCTAFTYLTTKALVEEAENIFLKNNCQRNIVKHKTLLNLKNILIFEGHNCNKHSRDYILNIILNPLSNILLNNYSKKQNDVPKIKNMPKLKRT